MYIYSNMQLKKIKRAEKKGTESVMDEKFALLFQSKFQTGDMQLNVSNLSVCIGCGHYLIYILTHVCFILMNYRFG